MQKPKIVSDKVALQYEYTNRISQLISKRDTQYKACIITYGCQQNENDSDKIRGMLSEMGYAFCDDASQADLVIINTCVVRDHAEQRVYGKIGALKKYKEQNPEMIIAVCGCMAQREHIAEKLKEKYKQVDLVFGPHTLYRLPQNLYSIMVKHERLFDREECNGQVLEGVVSERNTKCSAYVTIMAGCNNFCSYCIVPYVRGREKSRDTKSIIEEIKQLITKGYKDITLLGQNVNSYGKDLDENIDFSDLLFMVNSLDGDFRIHFMSSHPKDASKKLIDTIFECDKVCKHLHLPVQSGNDEILQKMNRNYTSKEYLDIINYAKEKMPDIVISTDIIVGFPGETDEQFSDTLELVKQVGYDITFSFLYSRRVGTVADKMPNQIPKEIKKARFDQLNKLQNDIFLEKNKKYIGKTVRVCVEGESLKDKNTLSGRDDGNKLVNFIGDSSYIGKFADVYIEEATSFTLFGRQVFK